MKTINNIEELSKHLGSKLASSPWIKIDQARINAFAEVTEDKQWIHLDPVRAEQESPYKNTIAHGFLVLSLIPTLSQQSYRISGFSSVINYGLNSVRFITPVVSGSRIRAHFTPKSIIEKDAGRIQVISTVSIEIEGQPKPACVAETMMLLMP